MKRAISPATIARLPLYYRTLQAAKEEGMEIISSNELSRRLSFTPEQIRKDLGYFGQFGLKGMGYYIDDLKARLGKIIGLQHRWRMAIVGIGSLGTALACNKLFPALGFQIVALFDNDPKLIGTEINGLKIYDFAKIKSIASRKLLDIGVITVPVAAAQTVANKLVDAGVKGIWNFAPVKLEIPYEVSIVNEDLTIGLSALSYHMAQGSK